MEQRFAKESRKRQKKGKEEKKTNDGGEKIRYILQDMI